MIAPHATLENSAHVRSPTLDARTLEEETVTGAIRTDFILSAEIMAISLASIAPTPANRRPSGKSNSDGSGRA
jgi:predicted DNA repair protein MutK